jgi:hypothetical protein
MALCGVLDFSETPYGIWIAPYEPNEQRRLSIWLGPAPLPVLARGGSVPRGNGRSRAVATPEAVVGRNNPCRRLHLPQGTRTGCRSAECGHERKFSSVKLILAVRGGNYPPCPPPNDSQGTQLSALAPDMPKSTHSGRPDAQYPEGCQRKVIMSHNEECVPLSLWRRGQF